MTQILWLVWDTSGSMAENGKRFIARGVARMAEEYCRLGYGSAELKLVAWGNEARTVDWNPEDEFPPGMLDCSGSANAPALLALLGGQPEGKILLVTDGFWGRENSKALKRWKDGLPPETLRVIKVGVDANPQLKGANVFSAEDVLATLDGWLEGGDEW